MDDNRVRLQSLRDFTVQIRDPENKEIVGTGIVVSIDGKIVTCAHVVEAALGVHPREAIGKEIGIYFPQARIDGKKVRIATVVRCFTQHDDDIVLLQLKDGQAPLGPEQIAIIGKANGSEGNEFQSYGYASIGPYRSKYATGQIMGPIEIDLSYNISLQSELIELRTRDIRPGMSGGAVLDKKRNLVIGLITQRWDTNGRSEDDNIGWAIDALVLTFDPINLVLHEGSLPLLIAPQPIITTEMSKVIPKQKYAWNNAPSSLNEWVGREELLKAMDQDWRESKKKIIGLIGFGGEGKSSLARRWIDKLLEDDAKPQPDGVFWWGFYDRPSIDEFFEAALNYIGGGNVDLLYRFPSSTAKAHFLAGVLHGGRYIFILDGLEALQHQAGDQHGLLKNHDLRQFLEFFASPDHKSFCLITSRITMQDLMKYTSYRQYDVERLNADDGRDLLKELGVIGSNIELDKLVVEWDGHALALSLLASYLVDRYHGDITRIGDLPILNADEPRYSRVRRVLDRYDGPLNEYERAFMKFFSAFRLPVDETAFSIVFRVKLENPNAINAPIASLDDVDFDSLVKHLMACRILYYNSESRQYTTHPLIRAYYSKLLASSDCILVQEMHAKIKDYYLTIANGILDDPSLEDLEPLIEAIYHACNANCYDEAFNISRNRINKGNKFWLTRKLGAWETALSILQGFFPYYDVSQEPLAINPKYKWSILSEVGFCMMNLGYLNQAELSFKHSNQMALKSENWDDASISYRNLAYVYSLLGELDKGEDVAYQALMLARKANNKRHESHAFARYAWISHLKGNIEKANINFKKAEILRQDTDQYKYFLYRVDGTHYAEHLIRKGDNQYAWKITNENLEISLSNHWSDSICRCHRVLGNLTAKLGQYEVAREHFDKSLQIARSISHRPVLIRALSARGMWRARYAKNAREAYSDLEEAQNYAISSGYRIYETDIHIGIAWAHIAAGDKEKAKAEAKHALQISKKIGYYWGKVDAEEVLVKINSIYEKLDVIG